MLETQKLLVLICMSRQEDVVVMVCVQYSKDP